MSYAFPLTNMGAADEFNALLYGETHPSTLNYLRSQFDNLSNTLTEPAKQFMEKGRELYEYFHNSDAMRFARDVVNRVMGTTEIRIDNIRELSVLCDFQDAGLVMQRWLILLLEKCIIIKELMDILLAM